MRRLTIMPYSVLIVVALTAVAALYSSTAFGAEVFRGMNKHGPVVLRLSESPCMDVRVLAALHEKLLDDRRFKASVLTWNGRDWASCWAEVRGYVLSIDEEGAPFQPVPRSKFKEESI